MKKKNRSIPLTKQNTIGEVPIYIGAIDDKTRDKWYVEAYPDIKKIGNVSKKWIEGLEVIKTKTIDDISLNTSVGMGNRTVSLYVTYVKVDEDYGFISTFRIDDEGGLFLNDELICTTVGHTNWAEFTLNLKKGWNKIEILAWNSTGGDGVEFSNKLAQDEFIREMTCSSDSLNSQSYVEETKEAPIQKVSIRPQVFKRNLVGKDMFDEIFEDTTNANKLEVLPPLKGGVLRIRYESSAEFKKQSNYVSFYAKQIKQNKRAFMFKPNTKYTFTYYVHEIENPRGGYPDIICTAGSGYGHVSENLGLNTVVITSDRNAHTGGGIFHIMIAGPDTVFNEGERRVFDAELISVVEGTEPQLIPGPFFPATGTSEGLRITTQDFTPKLGEYELDGDIPKILDNIENRIVKKNNEINVSWI